MIYKSLKLGSNTHLQEEIKVHNEANIMQIGIGIEYF